MRLTGCLLLVCAVFFGGCYRAEKVETKELLVYCGITMIRPVSEIADIISEQEGCRIIVTKGGSGNLLKSIQMSRAGDLYLPGSESYMTLCVKEGLVNSTVPVGYNKAALMVQKGNPKGITADLEALCNPEYYVVIGNPDSGSIGRETRKILESAGIYERVITNARELTTDSKDLTRVLEQKKADLVINWYATAFWPENEPYIDVITIDEKFATPERLVMGRLVFSHYPDIAKKMMDYAASVDGQKIFQKYGFSN